MGPCFDLICCWSRVENNFSQFLSFGQFLEWLIRRWSNHFLRVLFLVRYACKPKVKIHHNQFHRFHRHLQWCYYTTLDTQSTTLCTTPNNLLILTPSKSSNHLFEFVFGHIFPVATHPTGQLLNCYSSGIIRIIALN